MNTKIKTSLNKRIHKKNEYCMKNIFRLHKKGLKWEKGGGEEVGKEKLKTVTTHVLDTYMHTTRLFLYTYVFSKKQYAYICEIFHKSSRES